MPFNDPGAYDPDFLAQIGMGVLARAYEQAGSQFRGRSGLSPQGPSPRRTEAFARQVPQGMPRMNLPPSVEDDEEYMLSAPQPQMPQMPQMPRQQQPMQQQPQMGMASAMPTAGSVAQSRMTPPPQQGSAWRLPPSLRNLLGQQGFGGY